MSDANAKPVAAASEPHELEERAVMEAFANRFDTYGSDQIACIGFQSTKKAKEECRIRASIWADAAQELRTWLSHTAKETSNG